MYTLKFGGKEIAGLEAFGETALVYRGRLDWKMPAVMRGIEFSCDGEDEAGLAGWHDALMSEGQFFGTDDEGNEYTHLLFRKPEENELDMQKLRGDIVFLAMMTGVELDG